MYEHYHPATQPLTCMWAPHVFKLCVNRSIWRDHKPFKNVQAVYFFSVFPPLTPSLKFAVYHRMGIFASCLLLWWFLMCIKGKLRAMPASFHFWFLSLCLSFFFPMSCWQATIETEIQWLCSGQTTPLPQFSFCQSANGEERSIAQEPCWWGFHSVWILSLSKEWGRTLVNIELCLLHFNRRPYVCVHTCVSACVWVCICELWLMFMSLCWEVSFCRSR